LYNLIPVFITLLLKSDVLQLGTWKSHSLDACMLVCNAKTYHDLKITCNFNHILWDLTFFNWAAEITM